MRFYSFNIKLERVKFTLPKLTLSLLSLPVHDLYLLVVASDMMILWSCCSSMATGVEDVKEDDRAVEWRQWRWCIVVM